MKTIETKKKNNNKQERIQLVDISICFQVYVIGEQADEVIHLVAID